jgi:transcriptional regulator with XRE-family HTH domain
MENSFAEWLQSQLDERKLSSRQANIRTNVSYTTIDNILRGTQPGVETVVRIAKGFNADIGECLRLAGHTEVADLWQGREQERGGGDVKTDSTPRQTRELTYEPADDVEEAMSYYEGMPPTLRPAAKAALKALHDQALKEQRNETTHGKKAE